MKQVTSILVILVIVIGGFFLFSNKQKGGEGGGQEKIVATVHKSPDCGCCGVFVQYLKREDYEVNIENHSDMGKIKDQYGVPMDLESCHTTVIGGYVVEGHVPEIAISKLLKEKPEIDGIGMPGMPAGSPGMPGVKQGTFDVKAFADGMVLETFTLI